MTALQAVCDLDLEPLAGATLLVNAVALFGQDAFQAFFARDFEQSFPLLFVMIGIADGIAGDYQRSQFLFALFERKPSQIVAIEIEQIECVIEHGHICLCGVRAGRRDESRCAAASG